MNKTLRGKVGKEFDWIIKGQVYRCTIERKCPLCFKSAIVALPAPILAEQPDDTTHVCHPSYGGCNHGFNVPGLRVVNVL